MKQKVINAYEDGSPIGTIIESFNITYNQAISIIRGYKAEHSSNNTYTDEFKKLIANRDMNGGKEITRKSIAEELGINPNTVKKACEQFGRGYKDDLPSYNQYTRIDGTFTMKTCPSCKSRKINVVEKNTIYCKKCGGEFINKGDHVLKVNFEYMEE